MSWLIVGVAVLVVLAASLLKQIDWSDKAKQLIVITLSVLGGVATAYATGALNDATDVLQTAGLVYAGSQLIYAFIFKGTKLEEKVANVNLFGPNADEVEAPDAGEAPDAESVDEEVVAEDAGAVVPEDEQVQE